MEIKIRETGEVKPLRQLSPLGTGDWTAEIVGQAGATSDGQFTWDEEAGVWVSDQGTYDWWAQYLSDLIATDNDIEALSDEIGIDRADIRVAIEEETGPDYDDHRRQAQFAIDKLRDEYHERVSQAASALGRRGGQSTSEAKRAASRVNGRKGGRPRMQKNVE